MNCLTSDLQKCINRYERGLREQHLIKDNLYIGRMPYRSHVVYEIFEHLRLVMLYFSAISKTVHDIDHKVKFAPACQSLYGLVSDHMIRFFVNDIHVI